MQETRRRPIHSQGVFIVGSTVSLRVGDIIGTIVDVVTHKDRMSIEYAVIAFDAGPGEVTLYQPILWNLLRPVAAGFLINMPRDSNGGGLPDALHPAPMRYGGNTRVLTSHFIPTPQSSRVH